MKYYEPLLGLTGRNDSGGDLDPFTDGVAKAVTITMKTDGTTHSVDSPSAGKLTHGFIKHTIVDGELGAVMMKGLILAMSGGAINANDHVKVDANGKVVTGGIFADSIGVAFGDATGADKPIWIYVG